MLRFIGFLLRLILFSVGAISAYYTIQPLSPQDVVHCGDDIEEAKARGCEFDLYSFVYYPPPCFNRPLHTRFHAAHHDDVNWFSSTETAITAEEAIQGTHMVLKTDSAYYHELHCTYEWERLIMALAEGRPLDQKLASNGHSWHCSKYFLDLHRHKRTLNGTIAGILFNPCGLTGTEMYRLGSWELDTDNE
ncbi:hypothetical protein AC579_9550 [Pseudocercospora musae]|uniref:Uncharacterized protein n=1 Tax=Pseudocercospora musae TaxID=113226 RepID=A0A139I488_9PEZI|nr:hypothetical protein AC579_9550 [Pseudocercospora musae]